MQRIELEKKSLKITMLHFFFGGFQRHHAKNLRPTKARGKYIRIWIVFLRTHYIESAQTCFQLADSSFQDAQKKTPPSWYHLLHLFCFVPVLVLCWISCFQTNANTNQPHLFQTYAYVRLTFHICHYSPKMRITLEEGHEEDWMEGDDEKDLYIHDDNN